jgi:signal transduction histidine kinase
VTFNPEEHFSRFSAEAEVAMFRVLQESLTNVHRHSGSETAEVRLRTDNEHAILEIEDRGKGFDPGLLEQAGRDWTGALGVGVRGMTERMRQLKGKLEIIPNEGGTLVRATIPAVHRRAAKK